MGDYGMKVSKEGFDVKTCEDKDLVMSSSFNLLKTKSVLHNGGTITHDLGYVPIYLSCNTGLIVGNAGSFEIDSFANTSSAYSGGTLYVFYNQGF